MSNISLPCNKQESGSTTNVNEVEAWGGGRGIRMIGTRVLSNQNRESLGGRQQAGIGLEGSLNIIRGESAVFTHFQDATTKTSMVGSDSIMGVKRMVKCINMHAEQVGTSFNLKTKRLNMGRVQLTFKKSQLHFKGDSDTCTS